jgi:hypothetical protein
METITVKYNGSQDGAYLLGRLSAINIEYEHFIDARTINIYPHDQDDIEEADDIVYSLRWFASEFQLMKKLDNKIKEVYYG